VIEITKVHRPVRRK